jgi:two-component system sensor histidine kinase KdpD
MTDGPHRKTIQRSVGYALAGSAFALLVASVGVRLHVNFATTGFLHLLTVLVVAMVAGFWEATLTSAVALVCLNYFFVPPVYTLYVADPQNWVALLTFECTALLVSKLSIQKEREAYAAILERSRMVKLYELSRRTLLTDLHQRPGPQIVADICEVIEVDTVALLDATTSHVDMAGPDGSELARLAWATYTSDRDEDHLATGAQAWTNFHWGGRTSGRKCKRATGGFDRLPDCSRFRTHAVPGQTKPR